LPAARPDALTTSVCGVSSMYLSAFSASSNTWGNPHTKRQLHHTRHTRHTRTHAHTHTQAGTW
jgi:hypothetical protein